MAAPIVSPGSLVSDLSQSIFRAIDGNHDGRLALNEFATFLNKLVSGFGGTAVRGDLGSAATAIVTPSLPADVMAGQAGPADYAPVPGFDFAKLTDPSHTNAKYSPAVRVFSRAIKAGGLSPVSDSLASIVAFAKTNGFPNAKVAGSDTIDFGDGSGAIDVITDVGGADANWWFHNLP